jgi:glucan phosphoethanolaminetransferase (alkaline phosphatase superfamily)
MAVNTTGCFFVIGVEEHSFVGKPSHFTAISTSKVSPSVIRFPCFFVASFLLFLLCPVSRFIFNLLFVAWVATLVIVQENVYSFTVQAWYVPVTFSR